MGRLAVILSLMLCAAPVAAQEFATLKGHGGPIMGIAVAPSGQVATGSFDNSVGLWDGGMPRWLEGHAAAVTALTWGPEGTLVSGGDDFAVRVWGEAPRVLGQHQGKVAALAVSPNGRTVASGSWDGSIVLWSLDGDEGTALPAPGAGVNAVAYDGADTLYAATMAGALLRYDLGTDDAPVALVQHGFGINRLALGPGWIAYGAVDGGTRVIDLQTGAPIADLTLDRRPILAMSYNAPSHQLAVGDGEGYIMIVDTESWQITRDFRATRQGPVWALAFSPDGTVIHAGGLDDAAYSWPVEALDVFEPGIDGARSFLRAAETMPNGERQFMRKCSICHALTAGPSRKAGPTLHGVFGRRAGTVPGYSYSDTLDGSDITWNEATIDALFDQGPDHYIPGSKMPMQVIAGGSDRADLIDYLKQATKGE
ncbi:c-type cytochrome [Alloyangia pacifica]|uniref:Cytochrome c n=1 Tax=Alloyangia pacifica TaxID=311180 RepID=A0A1I6T5D1_9RHOB|nr:c-type cytochrome [Alloyangia pacifica]SDG98515.1 cytochrome c [Alloyangia pacifica]SFS84396.1 cytochrome c [Alloyangia pacifica]